VSESRSVCISYPPTRLHGVYYALFVDKLPQTAFRRKLGSAVNDESRRNGSNRGICQDNPRLGSHSSRFSEDIPGFMGLKKLCSGVPQNSVRETKCPAFFPCY
jgi:hypothetical protein